MMVELHDTVVADVAMGRSNWPEDVTGLAELKLEYHWRVDQVHLIEVDAGGT